MKERFLVAFQVIDTIRPAGVFLCCSPESASDTLDFDPGAGVKYENWLQLVGTIADILEKDRSEFEGELRRTRLLRNQSLSNQQLKLFGFPNMKSFF
jgi:hypothetical protein